MTALCEISRCLITECGKQGQQLGSEEGNQSHFTFFAGNRGTASLERRSFITPLYLHSIVRVVAGPLMLMEM